MLETTFLRLKKWVTGDKVSDYFPEINNNFDKIDASIGMQQGTINAQVNYFKIGRLVVVNGVSSGAVSLSANIYTTVGVLPVGFRPIETFTFVFNTMGGELKGQSAQVLPSGDIRLYPKDIGQSYWQFTAVFVTN